MGDLNKALKIYLAGKMSGLEFDEMYEWRKHLREKLLTCADCASYKLSVINPVVYFNFENERYQSEKEVMDYDLAHVSTSDIIIVNLDGLNTSDGTKYELKEAYDNGIPVIAFGENDIYEKLHPWTKLYITRHEDTVENVIEYIQEFYMI